MAERVDFIEQVSGSVAMCDVRRRGPLVVIELGIDETEESVDVLCSEDDARSIADAILATVASAGDDDVIRGPFTSRPESN